jgi:hypothetical protein
MLLEVFNKLEKRSLTSPSRTRDIPAKENKRTFTRTSTISPQLFAGHSHGNATATNFRHSTLCNSCISHSIEWR